MNEKSKAFELIEFVWNNEKTDSYLRVNIAMYEAVKLAIISQMKFNKEDFQNIFSKFSGGYWFGVNANGYRVTGFDFSTKKVYLVGYAISDWEEKGKKTLFNFTNNEWNEFRKQIKQF